ncbi:Ribulose-5-phosphate 4-epimerase and related epimerases and aldolases [Legionella steigerwaltii]|uniref:Ankyrin repeats (3 copies) n=1 Tax=Legionella steigerwaltii TaxID=460 RepID=A0A378L8S1_9GAMM|nr:ankyrin repeat domain-containing protein [Legionella steigerwaltii]KTD80837.1 Ankyrin repeats (3 copies) [Legionella steigerwaltii]STY23475.1 Ribulose-5-phosphate 4-epimerase and related epimerases and aldolases [Legionella steigerwaltii]
MKPTRNGSLGAPEEIISELVEHCRKGHKWGVTAILRKVNEQARGPLLNQRDHFGDTALTAAAAGGYDSLVKYLLKIPGVNPNVTTERTGFTPLIMAAAKGHANTVDTLIEEPTVELEIRDANGMTAAEEAEYSNHLDISDAITSKLSP